MTKNTNELGSYIKNARLKSRLSLQEVSKQANMAFSELSRIENGQRKKPSVLFLIGIAKALNLNIEKLMKLASYTDNEINLVIDFKQDLYLKVETVLEGNLKNIEIKILPYFEEKEKGEIDING